MSQKEGNNTGTGASAAAAEPEDPIDDAASDATVPAGGAENDEMRATPPFTGEALADSATGASQARNDSQSATPPMASPGFRFRGKKDGDANAQMSVLASAAASASVAEGDDHVSDPEIAPPSSTSERIDARRTTASRPAQNSSAAISLVEKLGYLRPGVYKRVLNEEVGVPNSDMQDEPKLPAGSVEQSAIHARGMPKKKIPVLRVPKPDARRMKGGKGLGAQNTTGKRHRKVTRDNILGVTKHAIRRLARRGGVKRISGLVYVETQGVLVTFLRKIVQDAVTYAEHAKRKTVTTMDVVYALKRSGKSLYGFGG